MIFRTLRPTTLRYCQLVVKRSEEGLTTEELAEMDSLGKEIEQRALEEAYKDVPLNIPTDAEVEEMAKLDHSRHHGFPAPHEL